MVRSELQLASGGDLTKEHRWIGLGTAEFTQEQATRWANVEGSADENLAITMSQVVCLRCDVAYLDSADDCHGAGAKPDSHRWISLMTLAMTSDDAARWADPTENMTTDLRPHSTNLLCSLCGQAYDQASSACPERVFWSIGDELS